MPGASAVHDPVETVFWLCRHPEPEPSAAGRCYGSLDVKLSAHGVEQAHCVAQALAREPLAAIYTSPRRRCRDAARILAAGRSCPLVTLEALRELDFGQLEGRTYDEIAQTHPQLYSQWMERPTEVHFPGGESFPELRRRVLAALSELRARHRGQAAALVTHGGVIRTILGEALGMDPANIFRLAQWHAGVSRIRFIADYPAVDFINARPLPG